LDISSGSLSGQLQSGREHDLSRELGEKLPSGSLWLRDLGYSSLKEYSKLNTNGVYHLSKVKSSFGLYDEEDRRWDLVDFLEKYCKTDIDTLERKVYLGFTLNRKGNLHQTLNFLCHFQKSQNITKILQ
jgi:hypothetical protein